MRDETLRNVVAQVNIIAIHIDERRHVFNLQTKRGADFQRFLSILQTVSTGNTPSRASLSVETYE